MVVSNNDAFFGGMRTGSTVSALNSMNTKAAEAELISRATQTAIVAARSILMSGGTEEVALKTAKAAAESVLNPQASDNDTVSGRSTLGSAFGGRKRKAKRQAEVVASMALMSASSGIRPAGSSMSMSEWDNGHSSHPYGRNIITFRQDEPSVLSGSISTRPPRIPTPKSNNSNPSAGGGPFSRMTSSSSTGLAKFGGPSLGASPRTASSNQAQDTSDRRFFSLPKKTSPAADAKEATPEPENTTSHSKSLKEKSKNDDNNNTSSSGGGSFLDKILNIKPTTPRSVDKKPSGNTPKTPVKLFEIESDSVSQNDTMDSDRQSSMDSSRGDEESVADTLTVESARKHHNNHTSTRNRREQKVTEGYWKTNLDPLILNVTKTLNIFTCGPLGGFSDGQAGDDLEDLETITSTNESPRARKGRHDRLSSAAAAFDSRDDTFDDNTTNYTGDDSHTEMTGREGRDYDDESDFCDPDFGFIESRSSGSTSDLLCELGMSNASEGAIQVRSSIRETMEKIVSKSKKAGRRGRRDHRNNNIDVDKKWLSYELREHNEEPEIAVLSCSKKKSKKASASISRRTPKKSNGGSSSNKSVGKKESFFFKKNKG